MVEGLTRILCNGSTIHDVREGEIEEEPVDESEGGREDEWEGKGGCWRGRTQRI